MKGLTQGSVVRHILQMAAPIAFFRPLYYLVDLYFIAQLGAFTLISGYAFARP